MKQPDLPRERAPQWQPPARKTLRGYLAARSLARNSFYLRYALSVVIIVTVAFILLMLLR